MPTYIARHDLRLNNLAILPGDEVPPKVLATMDPASWVEQGHLLKLDGNQARSLAAARDNLDKAQKAYTDALNAYTTKMAELEKKAGTP